MGPPAVKRRRLTPPLTIGEESPESTLKEEFENEFYARAVRWNLEQDYESRPRKKKKKERESTRLPIKTAEGLLKQVETPEVEDEESKSELAASDDEWNGIEEDQEMAEKSQMPMGQQVVEAKEELARLASLLNENPEEHVSMILKYCLQYVINHMWTGWRFQITSSIHDITNYNDKKAGTSNPACGV
jgi:nucleolar complex protein 3